MLPSVIVLWSIKKKKAVERTNLLQPSNLFPFDHATGKRCVIDQHRVISIANWNYFNIHILERKSFCPRDWIETLEEVD